MSQIITRALAAHYLRATGYALLAQEPGYAAGRWERPNGDVIYDAWIDEALATRQPVPWLPLDVLGVLAAAETLLDAPPGTTVGRYAAGRYLALLTLAGIDAAKWEAAR